MFCAPLVLQNSCIHPFIFINMTGGQMRLDYFGFFGDFGVGMRCVFCPWHRWGAASFLPLNKCSPAAPACRRRRRLGLKVLLRFCVCDRDADRPVSHGAEPGTKEGPPLCHRDGLTHHSAFSRWLKLHTAVQSQLCMALSPSYVTPNI